MILYTVKVMFLIEYGLRYTLGGRRLGLIVAKEVNFWWFLF